jgi:hypothetical protein
MSICLVCCLILARSNQKQVRNVDWQGRVFLGKSLSVWNEINGWND